MPAPTYSWNDSARIDLELASLIAELLNAISAISPISITVNIPIPNQSMSPIKDVLWFETTEGAETFLEDTACPTESLSLGRIDVEAFALESACRAEL